MEIRHHAWLKQMCSGFTSPMREDSPEILLMHHLCAGRTEEACRLFGETKQFGGLPAVDAPYGRFEGQEGIREFASGWLGRFNAVSAKAEPVCQTQAGGRSVTETVVSFVTDGMIEEVPMFVVGDLREAGIPGAGADALPEAHLPLRPSGDGRPEPADGRFPGIL